MEYILHGLCHWLLSLSIFSRVVYMVAHTAIPFLSVAKNILPVLLRFEPRMPRLLHPSPRHVTPVMKY